MRHFTSRLRALLVALAVLALSATAVLAGRPAAPAPQHPTPQGAAVGSETPDVEESEAPEAAESEAPDASGDQGASGAAGEHPDNHGKLVSEAAQADTPAGFDNHGAYVRTIAQANPGHANPKGAKPNR